MIEEPDYNNQQPHGEISMPGDNPESRATQHIPPQSTLGAVYHPDPNKPRSPRIKHHSLLGEESIAFYIGELDDPLVVQVKDRITLGRYGPYSTQPSLDLAPYGAFERGVSRLHATIYRKDGTLIFEDMDSNNGSYINAERIAPQVPHQLRSGDVLVLGSLTLEIYFKASESAVEQPATPDKETTQDVILESGPRAVQAIQGTIQLSAADEKVPLPTSAELVMYVKKNAGASTRQTLEIALSAEVDPGQEGVRELLERLLKSGEFTLTLKEREAERLHEPPARDQ